MFEYFYNEILRRTIISFGTLFNNITVKQDGSVVKVPLAYGPTQKFLARIEQSPDLNKPFAITLIFTNPFTPGFTTFRRPS